MKDFARKSFLIGIIYIEKESNNLEDNLSGIAEPYYLEYVNVEDFKQWVLSLRPKDIMSKGISKMAL